MKLVSETAEDSMKESIRSSLRSLGLTSSSARARYPKEGHFPSGSMGPKVQAAINFLKAGGERAIISHLERMLGALEGRTGTEICG